MYFDMTGGHTQHIELIPDKYVVIWGNTQHHEHLPDNIASDIRAEGHC